MSSRRRSGIRRCVNGTVRAVVAVQSCSVPPTRVRCAAGRTAVCGGIRWSVYGSAARCVLAVACSGRAADATVRTARCRSASPVAGRAELPARRPGPPFPALRWRLSLPSAFNPRWCRTNFGPHGDHGAQEGPSVGTGATDSQCRSGDGQETCPGHDHHWLAGSVSSPCVPLSGGERPGRVVEATLTAGLAEMSVAQDSVDGGGGRIGGHECAEPVGIQDRTDRGRPLRYR